MVVTNFIALRNRLGKDFRRWSRENFSNPGVKPFKKSKVYIEPWFSAQISASFIPRSFDLLAQLLIASANKKFFEISDLSSLLKIGNFSSSMNTLDKMTSDDLYKMSSYGFYADSLVANEYQMLLDSRYKNVDQYLLNRFKALKLEVVNNLREFVMTKSVNSDLLKSLIFLGKCNTYGWSGQFSHDMIMLNYHRYVDELWQLHSAFNPSLFVAKDEIYFEKVVGYDRLGGIMDLVIDGAIIDFKTTVKSTISRLHLNQLLCYYFLMNLRNADSIDTIGIYYSRQSVLYKRNLKKEFGKQEYDKLTRRFTLFVDRVRRHEESLGIKY